MDKDKRQTRPDQADHRRTMSEEVMAFSEELKFPQVPSCFRRDNLTLQKIERWMKMQHQYKGEQSEMIFGFSQRRGEGRGVKPVGKKSQI